MNFDAHIAKWNGKHITAYSGECVANAATYCVDNGKPIAYANAKDWWMHPALTGAFNFITNNPNDPNQLPKRGDIMIWNGQLPGSGGYGHIGMFDAVIAVGSFRSFDQNWGGNYCHFVTHGWGYIIGWMTPKVAGTPPQGGDEMIASREEAMVIYQMLRPNGGASEGEVAGTVGKRTYKQFLNDAKPEMAVRNQAFSDQSASLDALKGTINQLNQTITNITSDSNASKADKDAALVKVAALTSELETAHDQMADIQKQLTEAQNKPPVQVPVIDPTINTKLDWIINKLKTIPATIARMLGSKK